MGVKVSGIVNVEELLIVMDTTAKRNIKKSLMSGGKAIQLLAKKMAPVDIGNLEKSIKIREIGSGRDEGGRFARIQIEVYVDGEMEVPERPGKTIADYAYEINEHLTPAGSRPLGLKSQEKQAGQAEQVGGGFLERAAIALDREIDIKINSIFDGF